MKINQARISRFLRPANLFAALIAMVWFASTGAMASLNLATAFSDIWWNKDESGWGVNIVHQNNRMYLTFYIYRADGSPYWVSALLNYVPGSSYTFTGDLNENHGPWFGGPFTTPPWTTRKAGTATFRSSDGYNATLDYSVDGVPVSKNIQRFTLQNLDYSGVYDGVVDYITDSCTPATLNGQLVKNHWTMTVTHVGASMKVVATDPSTGTCTFNGTYAQSGMAGTTSGTYTCTDGTGGTFELDFMQRTVFGMTAQLIGRNSQCNVEGGMALFSID